MTLREWIKNVDLGIKVKIWGQNNRDPLFEGLASNIPWILIDFPIGPIGIAVYQNDNNLSYPVITIDVIDNIEKEEKI